jgi:hypothetical protein
MDCVYPCLSVGGKEKLTSENWIKNYMNGLFVCLFAKPVAPLVLTCLMIPSYYFLLFNFSQHWKSWSQDCSVILLKPKVGKKEKKEKILYNSRRIYSNGGFWIMQMAHSVLLPSLWKALMGCNSGLPRLWFFCDFCLMVKSKYGIVQVPKCSNVLWTLVLS